jgi:hypothetical protein
MSNLFTTALPYPMVMRVGTPVLVAAQGYAADRLGSVFGTLVGTAVLAAPVIIGVVLAAKRPEAILIAVMLPVAVVYGFALAVAGVRLAANLAEGKMPELCQAALHSAV